MGHLLGKLKLHLKQANLQHNDAGFLERMSPFVTVRINGREERSAVIEGGGRNPVWTLQFFEFECLDMNHEIHIEVRDRDMIGSEMIGHAMVPMHFFAKIGGAQEWIELKWQGFPAGTIHFISEYFPQAVVGGAQMAPQVMVQPAPIMAPAPMMGGLLGKLKLHLKQANLQHNDAGFLERMSPFVTVRINNREERSMIIEGGGRNPIWIQQFFEFEVLDMNHMIHIEVRDKDMIGSQMIGHAEVPMILLAKHNASEWIELKWQGFPAGTIHFMSEYFPQAVVGVPPPMVAPMQTTVVVEEGGMKQGIVKLHAVTSHLNYSDVGMLERMSPFVVVRINHQEWRSDICMGGGRNPQWGGLNRMEHIVMNPMHEVHIEVRDKDMIGSEIIGHAMVPLQFFLKPVEIAGHLNEWIELKRMGFDAGRIHMRSEFIPEVAMAMGGAGMKTGGGGGGVGMAVAAGAMVGTMAAIDIAEHDRRRGPEVVVVNEHHHGRRHNDVVVVNTGHHHHGRR